jgi:hypothetical protein
MLCGDVTTLQLSDPELLSVLIADLQTHGDVVVDVVGHDSIEVSLLGSYSLEANRLAVYLRVRAWEAGQRAQGRDLHVDLT